MDRHYVCHDSTRLDVENPKLRIMDRENKTIDGMSASGVVFFEEKMIPERSERGGRDGSVWGTDGK